MVVIFFPAADATGSTQDAPPCHPDSTVPRPALGHPAAVLDPGYAAQSRRPRAAASRRSVDLAGLAVQLSFNGRPPMARSMTSAAAKTEDTELSKACLIL